MIFKRFWLQVWVQNGADIHIKGCWKNDENMMTARMARERIWVTSGGKATWVLEPEEEERRREKKRVAEGVRNEQRRRIQEMVERGGGGRRGGLRS